MKIVLIGYMGSGKSTIGLKLATCLGLSFYDLDTYITETLGKEIPEIFREKGELFFRLEETKLLQQLLMRQDDLVLATGGGTPCYGRNMDLMQELADRVIYLKVAPAELVKRLAPEKENRPLLQPLNLSDMPEFIAKHLFERSRYYSRAQLTVDGTGKNPDALVTEICALL